MKRGRRDFVRAAASVALIQAAGGRRALAAGTADAQVVIENFSAQGRSEGTAKVAKVVKSDVEWRSSFLPWLTRSRATRARRRLSRGAYADNHADGLYRCICCDTALFDSKTKFESGTGWPSFWQPISALQRGQELATRASAWSATPSRARAATPTWATCSTTGRSLPACAIA